MEITTLKYLILIVFCCQSIFSWSQYFRTKVVFTLLLQRTAWLPPRKKRATESAVQVLKEGGNAIDAAVTLAFSSRLLCPGQETLVAVVL